MGCVASSETLLRFWANLVLVAAVFVLVTVLFLCGALFCKQQRGKLLGRYVRSLLSLLVAVYSSVASRRYL